MTIIKVKDTEWYKGSSDDDCSFMVMVDDDKAQALEQELERIIDDDNADCKYDAMMGAIEKFGAKKVKPDYTIYW